MATIYLPESDEKTPALIFFHGNGLVFANCDRESEQVLREKLLANNIALISVNYQWASQTGEAGILKDVREVVEWIKQDGGERSNIDANRIATASCSPNGWLELSKTLDDDNQAEAIVGKEEVEEVVEFLRG